MGLKMKLVKKKVLSVHTQTHIYTLVKIIYNLFVNYNLVFIVAPIDK
jgi:hypothetical protein